MKPPTNARPYALPRSLFVFIWACLKAEEAGENANTKPETINKSDWKPPKDTEK